MSIQEFQIVKIPTDDLSRTNKAILSPHEAFFQNLDPSGKKVEHIAIRHPKQSSAFVFSVCLSNEVKKGQIAFNLPSRKWAGLILNEKIEAVAYRMEPSQCLRAITFEVDFVNRAKCPANVEFSTDEMSKQFSKEFFNQAFTVGQLFGFTAEINNVKYVLELKVKDLEAVNIADASDEGGKVEIGLTTGNTVAMFERAEGCSIKLKGSMTAKVCAPKLFTQNWDFESMGVGGLSEQFNKIFRRAFASRLLPPEYAESIGCEHVRGILLYGPPGTGKTLIARQIGKMLLAREPKIVNGPEVLDKFVGQSEANIRKLFQEAEEEQARMGIHSGLHMIIFDEIDAICKSRGNSASSSGVNDNVVNQLLSKIDGVDSLHNVLLVGMTNRKDLIDEALLRPGRLEVQIEIGIPNQEGRLEILKIHTERMRTNNLLDPSVDLEYLAEVTKNFTGAELAGLIKAARALAINRVIKADSKVDIDKESLNRIKVTIDDFKYAMEHDVKPALGASEDQLKQLARPILQWDPEISAIQMNLANTVRQISEADEDRPYYVLLHGRPGSGLTTLAANIASESGFPFIRVYQALATADRAESAKVQYIKKLFDDAARSELSCIVIDDLEDILNYSHIGPSFSITCRTLFKTCKDLTLPKNHRMLVICTCHSSQFLRDLLLTDIFDDIVEIPSVTLPDQVGNVLSQLAETGESTFTSKQIIELLTALSTMTFQMGIKKLERLIKNAYRDRSEDRVEMFLERMQKLKLLR